MGKIYRAIDGRLFEQVKSTTLSCADKCKIFSILSNQESYRCCRDIKIALFGLNNIPNCANGQFIIREIEGGI